MVKAGNRAVEDDRAGRRRFCANGPVDPSEFWATNATGLRGCGLTDPEVALERVPELSLQVFGKLKRFVARTMI